MGPSGGGGGVPSSYFRATRSRSKEEFRIIPRIEKCLGKDKRRKEKNRSMNGGRKPCSSRIKETHFF